MRNQVEIICSSASEAAERLSENESKMSSLSQKVTVLKQNLADAESAIQELAQLFPFYLLQLISV